MRIGAFDIIEPLPELQAPHAIAVLRPWIDAGKVGTLSISQLETILGAKELGRLKMPGNFYDFTRYRPVVYSNRGNREIIIPNSIITYAKREQGNDLIFLNLLEPHMLGEVYVNSVLRLLQKMGVQRYCLIGSMYDMVPHTRPMPVTGGAYGKHVSEDLKRVGISPSNYEGPTTICSLVSHEATSLGMEAFNIIVHLPQYTELEEDYTGELRLLEVINSLYSIPVDEAIMRRAEKQMKQIDRAVNRSRKIKEAVSILEAQYDARLEPEKNEDMPRLSPDVESFLKEMEKRFKQD
jgi:predicted ATP-grasp superfamily ATP-dependent carboligase